MSAGSGRPEALPNHAGVSMYLDYYGLKEMPFRLSPDPDFQFESGCHAKGRAYLDYALMTGEGFVVLTGEVGSGKTTLVQRLLADWQGDAVFLLLEQTQLTPVELLQAILVQLTGTPVPEDGKVELLRRLRLELRRVVASGRRVVLCVDEAQALSFPVLEEIRFLTAMEQDKQQLLNVILVGQPELREVLDAPGMEQLRQRVRVRFHLEGLTPDEISAYVLHRLRVAGAAEPSRLFAGTAWRAVHLYTGGIPRLVNTLCNMVLLRGMLGGKKMIAAETVLETVTELGWRPYKERGSGGVTWLPRGLSRGHPTGEANAGSDDGALPGSDGLERRLAEVARHLERIAVALERDSEPLGVDKPTSVKKKSSP